MNAFAMTNSQKHNDTPQAASDDAPQQTAQPRQRPTVLFTTGVLLLAFTIALIAVLIIAAGASERINATQTAQPAITQTISPPS
jgi:anti-sigma factor RsiW